MNDARADWNHFFIAHRGSFLQSWEWGELQQSLGRRIERIVTPNARALAIRHDVPLKNAYWYMPRGPVAAHNGDREKNLQTLTDAARQSLDKKSIFLRIEPDQVNSEVEPATLDNLGFRYAGEVQPKETITIDLSPGEEEILSNMEHDTRYAIRAAERRGVRVAANFDLHDKQSAFPVFWEIFEATNKRHALKRYPKAYYERLLALEGDCHSAVFIAREANGIAISCAIIVFFGENAYYLYSGSKSGYGKLNAPSLVIWKAMQEAKRKKCRNFDLWGISNENANWAAISAFKRGFGGKEIKYVGAWDYVFNRGRYGLYRIGKRLLR